MLGEGKRKWSDGDGEKRGEKEKWKRKKDISGKRKEI